MVKMLIIINVIVFFAQHLTVRPVSFERFCDYYPASVPEERIREQFELERRQGILPQESLVEEWFALDTTDVLHGQIWRLTTYDFLHSRESVFHIIFNMMLLFFAGPRVEAKYGSQEFLAFYLLAGILSGAMFMAWGAISGAGVAIGASGATIAVMIVYAMNWPHHTWLIWGIIPLPAYVLALISVAFNLWPMVGELLGQPDQSHVAHSAHIGGILFGFLYVRYHWHITSWLDGFSPASVKKKLRRKPKLKVVSPEPRQEPTPPVHTTSRRVSEDVEARVDQLLEKIAQQGEASLTEEERQFLADASRRYRERR